PQPLAGSGAMFDNIADRYDLLNRIISLGVDQSWRRKAVHSLNLGARGQCLDLATGTGDLAIMIARLCPDVQVTGVDPSVNMLGVGHKKLERVGLDQRIRLIEGDAQALPFDSRTFDGTSIAFGIRNVPDRKQGLSEMARVTKLGGRVVILELSEPQGGLMGALARFHVHSVVPWLGALLSGRKEYRYLQKSIAAFPPASEFAELMQQAGLQVLQVVPLTFGVAHLYVATPQP
ncbi:MAG TPA: bifunctional demethylmenaquinone methyltransferase/2-methoxy-6-polyprenyl-1,4-benzoquinol methylase UbiE, partial [Polyangiaceae bacterium]|nr:bifunctional demethylmenaquinone methyltransferase/2-methoxy-6-polyprenyl-1,4-benzoquinol methylase UbiE [Polyangiaceae bacterium]